MTSRGSPDSTTSPQLRARALAHEVAVHGRGGEQDRDRAARLVGAAVGEHEDRVLRAHEPGGLACRASRARARGRARRALASNRHSSVPMRKRSGGSARSFSRSPGSSTGCVIVTRRACSGDSSSRFPCEPTEVRRLITRVSRCGSMAGFVTCAKCCLKYAGQQLRALARAPRAACRRPSSRSPPARRAPSARSAGAGPRGCSRRGAAAARARAARAPSTRDRGRSSR